MPDRMLAEIVQSHSHQKKNVLSTLWQLHHETLAVNQERWTDGGWTCNDEAEHFSLIPDLEPRSAWMSKNCQRMGANLRADVCVSQETSREVIS